MAANQSQQMKKPQQVVLTDDGELRSVAEAQERLSTVYCSQCGTVSRADARFCRNCGQPLDDPALDTGYLPPEQKAKRSDPRLAPAPQFNAGMHVLGMIVNVVKLIIVLGAVTFLYIHTNSVVIPIIILLGWAITEGIQAEASKR